MPQTRPATARPFVPDRVGLCVRLLDPKLDLSELPLS
ncbi:hypothetical protein HNQ79_004293 [Streptomyces candidus]|uniref:Uncharacterized protein n=1 Tax=Streptomyces candidus TaxID=67283 RepID=A0A7X0LRS4_9ACTN|nr:hypothetical protein [Streptomyces candidus]